MSYISANSSPIAAAAPSPRPKPARVNEPTSLRRPDAWRVNDALRQLSISRATLYKMVKNGDLRLAKVGGRTVVPDSEITRLTGEVA
jgi:excisionase family DNA binding protein